MQFIYKISTFYEQLEDCETIVQFLKRVVSGCRENGATN